MMCHKITVCIIYVLCFWDNKVIYTDIHIHIHLTPFLLAVVVTCISILDVNNQ